MTSFIALYRGKTISSARMIGVSTDSELVAYVSSHLQQAYSQDKTADDPVAGAFQQGRQEALRLIADEHKAPLGGGEAA